MKCDQYNQHSAHGYLDDILPLDGILFRIEGGSSAVLFAPLQCLRSH